MRRNSVYVAFILGGALAGEKVCAVDHTLTVFNFQSFAARGSDACCLRLQIVNSSFNTAWESNNQGVRHDLLLSLE